MLRTAGDLKGLTIGATDGDIGQVDDLYFDDESWAIRYLAVDTGGWLSGRKVLITPRSLQETDLAGGRLNVQLTKDQVKGSPEVDMDKPVSRQYETSYFDYYGYPYYWVGPYMWGPVSYPPPLLDRPPGVHPQPSGSVQSEIRDAMQREQGDDFHLRSVEEVKGYYIEAMDGDIGHVEEFIIDDQNWAIRYFAVDTRNWLPGKKVLISPQWIDRVSWHTSKVYVDVSRESVKNSPEYDKSRLSRDYENRLYEHYDRSGYWSE